LEVVWPIDKHWESAVVYAAQGIIPLSVMAHSKSDNSALNKTTAAVNCNGPD